MEFNNKTVLRIWGLAGILMVAIMILGLGSVLNINVVQKVFAQAPAAECVNVPTKVKITYTDLHAQAKDVGCGVKPSGDHWSCCPPGEVVLGTQHEDAYIMCAKLKMNLE